MTSRTKTVQWADPSVFPEAVKGKTGREFLELIISGALPQAPISATLDFKLIETGDGIAKFEGVPNESLFNPMGSVHGGWAATLLDSAMGSSVMSICDANTAYTTAQLQLHLTRAILPATGKVIAEGKVVHRGKQLVTAEGRLTDDKGRVLAHGTTTCMLFPR
ncbi:MAG: PaaI family thioesterase [Myxococcaceae bacterium]